MLRFAPVLLLLLLVGCVGESSDAPDQWMEDAETSTTDASKSDRWTEAGFSTPDGSLAVVDAAAEVVETGPEGCTPGDVFDTRVVAGGLGCLKGQKMQALTCDDAGAMYVWVDLEPFDGSARECEPDAVQSMGSGCEEEVRVCDNQTCTWGAYELVLQCPEEQIVYVNFDGQKVDDCPGFCDEPHNNKTWIVGDSYGGAASSWTFPPFTRGRAARDEILNKLSGYYRRYKILFEETRPANPPYTMVVVSDAHLLPNHGVCPLDCDNSAERTCLVNKTDDDQIDTVARYVAHELGHSFGLHHVSSAADIMVWNSVGSSFTSSTLEQDACGKSKGALQDAPAVLAKNLGLRSEQNVGASCYVSGAGGTCIDENVTSCTGTIHSGACPGPAQIRCCVP